MSTARPRPALPSSRAEVRTRTSPARLTEIPCSRRRSSNAASSSDAIGSRPPTSRYAVELPDARQPRGRVATAPAQYAGRQPVLAVELDQPRDRDSPVGEVIELPRQPVGRRARVRVGARDQPLLASELEQAVGGRVHSCLASRARARTGTLDQRQLQPQGLGGLPGGEVGLVGAAVEHYDRLEAARCDSLRRERLEAAGDVVLLVARGDHDYGG
jgi:hypothetical protein